MCTLFKVRNIVEVYTGFVDGSEGKQTCNGYGEAIEKALRSMKKYIEFKGSLPAKLKSSSRHINALI